MNSIDPLGLHDRPFPHSHSKTQLYNIFNDPAIAITNPFTGHIKYSPSFKQLHPLEKTSVDYHELVHKELGLSNIFVSEKKVWKKEIQFINNMMQDMGYDIDYQGNVYGTDYNLLENWFIRNIRQWEATYNETFKMGNPCE